MTERLYHESPHTTEFDATIVDVQQHGERMFVRLDRTAFYPTTGGQPFDTGTLGPARVVDVVDDDDGVITHVVERGTENREARTENGEPRAPNPEPGAPIHGTIDWPRRFDHMQQHTGQ